MHAAVMGLADSADVIVKAAAVADFRPRDYSGAKIKKDAGGLEQIVLEPNPDILAELGHRDYRGARPVLVGFAAETDDDEETIEALGRRKLQRKRADLMVVNRVDGDDAGFATDTNKAVLVDASGDRIATELVSKDALADAVLDGAGQLLATRRAGQG
jgi:phosphopantothenoylcysteine decarboxylase/phosphopantothenate--cysteine ligase